MTRARRAIILLILPSLSACDPPPITDNGVVGVFGGIGLRPGEFGYPRAIAADGAGSVFVVDKHGRVQRFDAEGRFETEWTMPLTAEGKPVGLSVHPDGRVFAADTHYHRVCVFDRDGHRLGTFGSEGTGDGEFLLPTDVAFDAKGFIYVAEYQGNDRITRWSPDLRFVDVVSDAPIEGKRLARPAGIDIDDEQTLWIADACNHRVVRMTLDGEVLTVFGEFGDAPGQMRYPYDIDISPGGAIVVCEYEGNRIQWFDKNGRSLRVWGKPGRHPGELFAPWGLAFGADGRLYVVEGRNHRVQIVGR